ncbi:DUF5959 family protein [Yinghuangia soli]|uniref:DUF5959 family protein n=1 Tax=Yinghuangia soli TaxID=2908204 RepID=A0AA41U1G6_9ACTN|nr:DUF5959 family protein [Yinghuangia soli]MCF2530773.1 DUF5959 family protein [Yinghuangia soli]
MGESETVAMVELFRIADEVQGVTVRFSPVPRWVDGGSRMFAGTIAVHSDWITAETDTHVDVDDDGQDSLDWWETILDRFEAWEAADAHQDLSFDWPPAGESGYVTVSGEDGVVSVRVCDGPRTSIGVEVPVDVREDWIAANRALLAAARTVMGRG